MTKNTVRNLLLSLLIFPLFLAFSSSSAFAWQVRNGDNLTLTNDFKESLFVTGQSVTIKSNVDGDLYCAGQSIKIEGTITGDVLCAAQDLEISGKVLGNVRSAGQSVTLNSQVSKNVNLFGQSITVGDSAKINGELYTAGKSVIVNGQVVKTWGGAAQDMTLNGRVQQTAQLATQNLILGKSATVSGGITRLKTDSQTRMAKTNFWHVPTAVTNSLKAVGKAFSLTLGLIYGLIIVWLFPTWLKKTSELALKEPGKNALMGLLIWLVAPVLIVLSIITLVGIPLALILGLALMLLSHTSYVVTGTALGSRFLDKKTKLVWMWLAGYLAITLASWIPVLGWIVKLAAVVIATGAIKLSFFAKKNKK